MRTAIIDAHGRIAQVNNFSRLPLYLRALIELGPRQLGLYALYKLLLKTGFFPWVENIKKSRVNRNKVKVLSYQLFFDLPDPEIILDILGSQELDLLKAEVGEIVEGEIRLFGAEPVALNLVPPGQIKHWSYYERDNVDMVKAGLSEDIKFIWEPARFGWAMKLGRAYYLVGDESYSEAFWRNFEIFQKENLPYLGPNWISAQEAAIRIISFCFALHAFESSVHTTEERKERLLLSIVEHAERIPHTMIYARAQSNNHLLSEAIGLITASILLPDYPNSKRWEELGWKWLRRGLVKQIDNDGAYCQQSTNYHRFLLQMILWANVLDFTKNTPGKLWTNDDVRIKAKKAVLWLLALCDEESGQVPNLGPNDSSYIFPLTDLAGIDYRPVLQAGSSILLNKRAFVPGVWDEMTLWFTPKKFEGGTRSLFPGDHLRKNHLIPSPIVLQKSDSWGYFRVARFINRPGHADQLHLDLWWKGLNITKDPGTYLYNGEPPWNNPFTHSAVHNTITIDGQEQMQRVSRFLYLDRAKAQVVGEVKDVDGFLKEVEANHNGYRKFGLVHSRSVKAQQNNLWVVNDRILQNGNFKKVSLHSVRLHWLLPDWDWMVDEIQDDQISIHFASPHGWIDLILGFRCGDQILEKNHRSNHKSFSIPSYFYQIARCGELVSGSGMVSPVMGWTSTNYGKKEPALSVALTVNAETPIYLTSEFHFPENTN